MTRNNLGKNEQISVQSNFACVAALAAIVDELEAEGVGYLGKKPTRQAVVNGMLLWIAAMERQQRKEILGEAIVLLEDMALGRSDDRREFQLISDLVNDHHAKMQKRSTQGVLEQAPGRANRATIVPIDADVPDAEDEQVKSPASPPKKGRGKK